jgi:hypothetical protein
MMLLRPRHAAATDVDTGGSCEGEETPSRRRIPPFPADIRAGGLLLEARTHAIAAAAASARNADAKPQAAPSAARCLGEAGDGAVHGGVIMRMHSIVAIRVYRGSRGSGNANRRHPAARCDRLSHRRDATVGGA